VPPRRQSGELASPPSRVLADASHDLPAPLGERIGEALGHPRNTPAPEAPPLEHHADLGKPLTQLDPVQQFERWSHAPQSLERERVDAIVGHERVGQHAMRVQVRILGPRESMVCCYS